jgi:hypothetical protein
MHFKRNKPEALPEGNFRFGYRKTNLIKPPKFRWLLGQRRMRARFDQMNSQTAGQVSLQSIKCVIANGDMIDKKAGLL